MNGMLLFFPILIGLLVGGWSMTGLVLFAVIAAVAFVVFEIPRRVVDAFLRIRQ